MKFEIKYLNSEKKSNQIYVNLKLILVPQLIIFANAKIYIKLNLWLLLQI